MNEHHKLSKDEVRILPTMGPQSPQDVLCSVAWYYFLNNLLRYNEISAHDIQLPTSNAPSDGPCILPNKAYCTRKVAMEILRHFSQALL
mmetsp:Transcript_33617/g.66134  ORF Transcript_33617/g.66134 Transcript_33617/m.66134 type:complete len:89 (-) Transcript_33617:1557-1823(-)